MESHSLSGFAPPNAPFLSNPMAAMIGSNLFGPQPFPMSNTAVSGTPISNQVPATLSQSVPVSGTSGERKSTGLMPNPVLDKGMHPGCLPGTGNSLSGISMRGNQKYSAYYQHQRKQGFHQLNANNMDYPSSGTSSRRQGTPLTTPLSGSRYASRRFRGNLAASGLSTHGVGLDTRGGTAGSNVPGGSRLPGVVRAPATAIFPGFRGTGPYGNNGGSVSVPSVNAMATTTTSNKQTIPNGGPGSKLQSPTDPMQLAAAAVSAGCTTTPSVNAMNSSGTSEPAATRHRDTAFLCSCGQDFESLYVFTLHMKDTGHKPKSDQSERDIPKLVRGQDMWINSETEQTREILRCMRCHQSFRNLPELTMHMMKTNHYSEIVYNDSGRLVFVNPDDPHHPHSRRGSANPNVASGGVSPAKSTGVNNSSGHWLGRRGSRGPAVTTPSNTSSLTPTNTNQTVPEVAPVSKSMPNRLSDPIARQKTDSSTDSNAELRDSQANKEIDFSEETDRTGPTSEPNKVRGMENTPQSVPTESQSPSHQQSKRASIDESTHPLTSAAERDSPMSTASIKPESMDYSDRTECSSVSPQAPTNKETNVLRQIETFVENNLPRTPKGLSVKVDQGSSSSSHKSASSPLATMSSDVSSRYSYGPVGCPMNSTSDSAKSSPSSHRKRTHSEASLSAHGSPVPSPASDQEKRSKPILTNETAGKIVIGVSSASGTASTATMPLTPTSPGVTSTTSEFASPLRENPLSSLQKLVETTHKPVPPSAAFSTPTGVTASSCFSLTSCVPNSLFVSCNGSGLKNATHSTSNNPTRISHTGGGNSSGPSSGPRSLGSPMDISGDSPFMTTNTGGSHSPGSQFAPIMLPATENENLIPALSALYAYVEKSSSNTSSITSSSATMQTGQSQHQHQNQQHHHHQQQQHNQHSQDTGIGHKPDYLSPNNAEEKSPSTDPSQCQQSQGSFNSPLDKITSSPALQAIYAAAMSSLAAQYLTAQQGSVRPTANLDPLEAFKQAATNFQAMLGEPKSDSADQAWLKMLQLFTGKPFQTDNECAESVRMSGTPDEEMGSIETEKRTNQSIDCAEVNRTQTRTPIQTQNTNVNSAATSTPFTTTTTTVTTGGDGNNNQNNVGTGRRLTGDGRAVDDRGCVRTPDSTKGADSISTVHSSPSPSKLSSSIDACSYANLNHMNARSIYTNSPNSYHPQLPNVLSGRYPSMQTRPIQNTTQSPALMTTMITKKAKCHFCGKPFANKGQVRLHISKNKCPCLLQQSCHVAALAAAFGSDSRPLTNANPAPSKSFLKDPMMGAKTRSSAEDFLASLSYPTTGANPIPGDSSDSAPSALSLLKERFQNFDLSHSPLRSSGGVSGSGNESKTSCSSYTGATKSSESDSLFAAAAAAASYASSTFGQALQSQPLMVPVNDGSTAPPVSWPFGAPPNLPLSAPSFTAAPGALTSSAGGGNPVTAAAANASHLAAMALLAQTLVQLTSSQTAQSSPFRGGGGPLPTVSGGSDSFSDPSAITAAAVAAAAAAQAPNRSLSTPTSSSATGSQNPISSIPLSPFMNSAAALNLDLLMNQTALMKQLASMTSWSDPNATRHRSEDESNAMSNPFLALSNCRNPAPNGLP
ncbi:unnamed protein product [Echinostoma caproni]|uniref:C2H2-type domain-containing protein n=1 Tax=Echinostoma caproni TaxID=27848 RepID=A0A183B3K6_9TREM|nr:unnamed protein product [Echinostoma caproni]